MCSGVEGGRETGPGTGHGDVSGVTTLSKEGGCGQPGKQGLDATAQVLAFPLRACEHHRA